MLIGGIIVFGMVLVKYMKYLKCMCMYYGIIRRLLVCVFGMVRCGRWWVCVCKRWVVIKMVLRCLREFCLWIFIMIC